MNLAVRLAERAGLHPDRPALIEIHRGRRRVVSYGHLHELAAAFAGRLARADINPGDRVVVFVPVSIALYAVILGIFHRGATAVFVDPGLGRESIESAVRTAAPRAFAGILRAHAFRLLSPALRAVPHAFVVGRDPERIARSGTVPSEPAQLAGDAPALVTFTTGSTGRPKAVLRTHGFLWTQHEVLARHLAVSEGTVDLPTLPVFVLHDLAAGATAVIADLDPRHPERADAIPVASIVQTEGVTTLIASPALADRIVRRSAQEGARFPVEHLYTGGAPIDPPLARRLADAVAGRVMLLYGSTEAEPIAEIDAEAMLAAHEGPDALAGGLCVGRPVAEIEVALLAPDTEPDSDPSVDAEGAFAALRTPAGEPGEVAVTGPHVLPSYWKDPESDRRFKITDGRRTWHRTGDGARIDAAGRLWLLGRVKERIVRDHRTWWSLPVEQAARALPGVRHAAYFPLAGEGSAVHAVVVFEGDESFHAEWTLERVRDAVAPAPVDRVVRRTRIPRDPRHHSKTDLTRLRKEIAADPPRTDR
ncbi:MAG: AMP-binding protein [Candidatus Eiseniibacteriota bacterium]